MMSRTNGHQLSEMDHIKQSITDILTTPIGSRIMRRDYGSMIADLIDQPKSEVLVLKLFSAIYTAITKWENRVSIEYIKVVDASNGSLVIDLEAIYLIKNQTINLNIPLQMGALT